ncbi:POU domain class 2-associating factor 1 isoform X2 [Cololabis saira]|uniref:POU domain class 2-associating factor 1 isoform X2 n=1 Tax=Cololabis saira TaxID=129043 RepID=UPI002AD4C53D|nr:POU domain class 2-associating factor 1 isoform X2 [Cololabis saira]
MNCMKDDLNQDLVAQNSHPSFQPGVFGADVPGASLPEQAASPADGVLQCSGWKFAPAGGAPQPAPGPWSVPDFSQPDSAQTLAYPAGPALTADVYMQTLCPSYTMLTYTHTPLLTNLGTIPVAPAQTGVPQMELPDSGLTYLPWAQPLTTISTMPTPGVPFGPGSAALPGSPLVRMPLSMSLTTMIPGSQLEAQGLDAHSHILELPQHPNQQLDPETQGPDLDDDPEVESESPSLLDKLLEDHKGHGAEEDKDSFSNSLFIPDV